MKLLNKYAIEETLISNLKENYISNVDAFMDKIFEMYWKSVIITRKKIVSSYQAFTNQYQYGVSKTVLLK